MSTAEYGTRKHVEQAAVTTAIDPALSDWHAWMHQQEHILRLLQEIFRLQPPTDPDERTPAWAELGQYSDPEIARACAEGAVCLYLKTREAKVS